MAWFRNKTAASCGRNCVLLAYPTTPSSSSEPCPAPEIDADASVQGIRAPIDLAEIMIITSLLWPSACLWCGVIVPCLMSIQACLLRYLSLIITCTGLRSGYHQPLDGSLLKHFETHLARLSLEQPHREPWDILMTPRRILSSSRISAILEAYIVCALSPYIY